MTTIEAIGSTLQITTTSPELADHHWLQRDQLCRLTGTQRLRLLVQLGSDEPLELNWEPAPL